MSLVGTRPPLISETNLYELHHKARLKIEKADERAVIQILRGIAIVLVVIHHVMKCFSLSNELNTLLTIINTVHLLKTSYNKLIQFSNPVCGNMLGKPFFR